MNRYFAEFLGTSLFILLGCGASVFVQLSDYNFLTIAVAFGMAYMLSAFLFRKYCDCHFNPLLSFAFFLEKRFSLSEFFKLCGVQICGTVVGAVIICLTALVSPDFGSFNILSMTNQVGQSTFAQFSLGGTIILELLAALIFTMFYLTIINNNKIDHKYLFVGFAIILFYVILIPVTCGSINPSKCLGTALVVALFKLDIAVLFNTWIWVVVPFIGAFLGFVIYGVVKNKVKD